MKKILLGLVISVLLLGGCSNKSEEAFQSAMTDGIEAVANEEYAKAEAYFETALKEKSDDKKAKNYLAGVEDIQTLLKYQEEGNLEEGLTLSTKISEDKDLPDTIKKQVKVIGEEFTSIKTTLDESTKLFTDAEKLAEEKKYSESNEKLKVIQDKKLEGTYYTELLAKTTELSKKNSAEIEKAAAEKEAADQKAKEEAEQKAQAEAEQKAAEEAAKLKINSESEALNAVNVTRVNGVEILESEGFDGTNYRFTFIEQGGTYRAIVNAKTADIQYETVQALFEVNTLDEALQRLKESEGDQNSDDVYYQGGTVGSDEKGQYWEFRAYSKKMQADGGSGTLAFLKVYQNGDIVDNYGTYY